MGGTQSTGSEKEPLAAQSGGKKGRTYRPPDIRKKERFMTNDVSDVTNTFEASVDKYDMLLVFRITEGFYTDLE